MRAGQRQGPGEEGGPRAEAGAGEEGGHGYAGPGGGTSAVLELTVLHLSSGGRSTSPHRRYHFIDTIS